MPVPPGPDYTATALYAPDGSVADVRLAVAGKVRHLAGRGGAAAERDKALAVVAEAGPGCLPVFIGAGLGAGIAAAREAGLAPVFVLDRETAIDAATGVRARFAGDPAVRFCHDPDPLAAAAQAADAARSAGFARLCPVAHPAYARLNPDWYAAAAAGIARYEALRQKIGYRKFTAHQPRVLILRRPYFLYREIEAALTRLAVPHLALDMGQGERGEATTVEALLAAITRFRPDFALTVNHLGLDRQGRLAGLLHDIGLPLASWFVDSPRLILHDYAGLATPGTMLFSYDADAAAEMRTLGYAHTAWLPLATDTSRFTHRAPSPGHPWQADVSFVGASMVSQAAKALARLGHVPALAAALPGAALAFAASPEKSARAFLLAHPATSPDYAALAGAEDRLAAEQALTWEATRLVRQACVGQLLPFAPLIAGDAAWDTVFPQAPSGWRRLAPLEYYEELPRFYPQSAVSLNTTSLQMKGAVNQRVFDVPACGGFVLTDAREQLGELFEIGRETAVYDHPEAIGDMVRHYLAHPAERARITEAARQRILAEHTYDKRLAQLLGTMQKAFGH